jgi:hypothetical protein
VDHTTRSSSSSSNLPQSSSTSLPHAPPPQQPSSNEITPATAVAVTRLAYQEVENYRERLRRKREEMEGIDSSSTSSQQQQTPSPSELSDLNALLLENATNINNAVLLQRALYALRIHRGSLTGAVNDDGIDTTINDGIGDASDRRTSVTSDDQNPSRSNSLLRTRSRSEHTGLDQLALNRLLTLSSSIRSSGTAGSGSGHNSTMGAAAHAAAASLAGDHQPPSLGQRRHTDLDSTTLQVGAYHLNEPAPLLFRRTFAHPNRRETRQATRRATLDTLRLQRMSNATDNSSVGEQEQEHQRQQPPQHQFISSLDSGPSAASNSDDNRLNNEEHEIMDEEFANTLQYHYSPSHNHATSEHSITARVTPYNPDDGYNRRHLGTLLESTQSQQSSSSINSNPRSALLTAQAVVRRQSLRARQMIQAVLVSDEIVEAVEAEHIPYGDGIIFPNDLEQMDMMEELLEEKEEEVRMMEDRYRRRERVWMVIVTMLIVVVVALIVVVIVANKG